MNRQKLDERSVQVLADVARLNLTPDRVAALTGIYNRSTRVLMSVLDPVPLGDTPPAEGRVAQREVKP